MTRSSERRAVKRGRESAEVASQFKIERIVQEHSRGCALACIAMAGEGTVTYDEVAHRAYERGWLSEIIREGCSNRRIRLLLTDLGIRSAPPKVLKRWEQIETSLAIVMTAWPKSPSLHVMLYERIDCVGGTADRLLDPLRRMPTGIRWDVTRVLPRTYIALPGLVRALR